MADTAEVLAITFAILQALVFTVFGLVTLLFGPMVENSVIVLQAILASGYDHLIQMFILFEPRDLFNVIGSLIIFICGVITLAFAAIKNKLINTGMQGLVGGFMLGDTLMAALGPIIMKNVGKCTDIGEPSLDFPKGEPTNCENFLIGLYVKQGPVWAITLLCGYIATMPKVMPYTGIYSCAITGSSLFMRSLPDVIYYATHLINKEKADEIVLAINSFQLIATYIMAGFGTLFLISTKSHMDAMMSGSDDTTNLNCCQNVIFANRFLKVLLWLVSKMEGRINRLVEKENTASGEGKEAVMEEGNQSNVGVERNDEYDSPIA